MPYLLDTNVVTQLLKRTPPVVEKYQRVLQQGEQVYLSAVVYYEVKRGLLHLGATKQLQQLDVGFKNVLYWAPGYRTRHGIEPLICGQNVVGGENPMTMTGTSSSQTKHTY